MAKQCPGCKTWLSLDDLMFSPRVIPQGMQLDPSDHAECYFQFAHLDGHCMTSFLMHSSEVVHLCDLLAAESAEDQKFSCPGYCTEIHELASCRQSCSHRHFRQFLLSLWWTRTAPSAATSQFHAGADDQFAPPDLVGQS